jgi:hypothetical protein
VVYIKKKISKVKNFPMKVLALFISIFLLFILPATVLPDIIVYDIVVPAGKEVMLKAEVKGKFFRKGGELVEFYVNKKYIGKILSGGDGFAFKQFIPSKTGKYQITAKVGKDEGKGLLLSLKKGSRIVVVDVEGSLLERFTNKPGQGSQKVIKVINKRFPVIFIKTGPLSTTSVKEWLRKNEFPDLPLIPWEQGTVFSELAGEGFRIKAVIGNADVINSSKEYKPLAFSFEEVEDAVEVKDWEEIRRKLN